MGKCFGSSKPPTLLVKPIILISEMPISDRNHQIWIRAGIKHLGDVFPLNQFIWSFKGKTSPNYSRPAPIQFSRFWPIKFIIVIRIISITKKMVISINFKTCASNPNLTVVFYNYVILILKRRQSFSSSPSGLCSMNVHFRS